MDLGVDLTACDREPIHIPGSVQPHGLLLIVDPESKSVIGAAGDVSRRLRDDWLGCPWRSLFGEEAAEVFDGRRDETGLILPMVTGISETFDAAAHWTGGLLAVELEPVDGKPASAASMFSSLEADNLIFERAITLGNLCERAASAFQRLTGFDRVMVYQFLDDGAGVVLAEESAPGMNSFLNHHFPATDIPVQARALYVRNRIRVIPDVTYEPAPVRSASTNLKALDMSDLSLRSVSPIHIQYLKNMGVGASASISIVRDGVLWGLIACHNQKPQGLPCAVRMACQALASSLSRQIRAKEEAEHYRERIRLRSLEDAVIARFSAEASLEEFFASTGEELCTMLAASGFAAVQGGKVYRSGAGPTDAEVLTLATWVLSLRLNEPVHSDRLSEVFSPAAPYADRASGLLSTTMATEQPTVLMWFRPEALEVVNWAGNPHKASDANPNAGLTPRASFESWSQAVRGRSRPWTLLEIESASRLMRTIFEARQNRRVRDLAHDLAATVGDNTKLLLQKDYLIKEVNHRTQNSLQLVSAFLALQASASDSQELEESLNEAQRRISAVSLVHRRLFNEEAVETVDLSRYLDDLCTDIRSTMDKSWGEQMSILLSPIVISADRAVQVGLILTELVINANKYAYGGRAGPIAITLEQHGARFRLVVADNGVGRSGDRKGFGSKMLNAMVGQLTGALEEGPNVPGLRIALTAPII